MTTHTSWSTKDGNGGVWSIIRADDTNSSTGSLFSTWWVKGPTAVYGGYEEDQAKRCLNEKIGVSIAASQRQDVTPVRPTGNLAKDCAACGRE